MCIYTHTHIYTHTDTYTQAIKKSPLTTTWMILEGIMLSEMSVSDISLSMILEGIMLSEMSDTDKYCMISLTRGI